jgi:hypothetical protein
MAFRPAKGQIGCTPSAKLYLQARRIAGQTSSAVTEFVAREIDHRRYSAYRSPDDAKTARAAQCPELLIM